MASRIVGSDKHFGSIRVQRVARLSLSLATCSAFALALLLGLSFLAQAQSLPPKPATYVADTANILPAERRSALEAKLEAFAKETSTQALVVTFPKVPEGFVMEDFTQRIAEFWGVGKKEHDNGVVLFVFPRERALRIEVGYGLEGVLPDALAKRIIANEILPAFKAGDMPTGIERGMEAILAATRDEYTANTNNASAFFDEETWILIFIFLLILLALWYSKKINSGGDGSSRGGRSNSGWGSGSGSGSDGGGFSGGGGSFGGGGASGRW